MDGESAVRNRGGKRVQAQTFKFLRPSREYRELAILSEIGRRPAASQRALARAASMCATMANAYVDGLVERGLVEVSGETNRTYRYALTDAGRRQCDQLLRESSYEAVELFARTRREVEERLEAFRAEGVRTVALLGATDAAELIGLAAQRTGIGVAAVADPDPARQGAWVAGRAVAAPSAIEPLRPDAVLVASLEPTAEVLEEVAHLEREGIRVLRLF